MLVIDRYRTVTHIHGLMDSMVEFSRGYPSSFPGMAEHILVFPF